MDFYEDEHGIRDNMREWRKARDEIADRHTFRLRAIPILHAVHNDLGVAFEQADTIYDEIERRAEKEMNNIAHLKERKNV